MPLGRGGGVNSVGFFPPAVPTTTPTHGHFVLSSVSLALRDPRLHLRSHGKIGDCEQSRQIQAFFNNGLLAFNNASHHQHSLPNHLHIFLFSYITDT